MAGGRHVTGDELMDSPSIYIEAPARLHLGFLDLEGGLGRRFGGLGLTLNDITTKILVHRAKQLEVLGDSSGRVQKYAEQFFERKGLAGGCRIEVIDQIIDHSGLGSGTQLALAVGTAIAKLFALKCDGPEIAAVLNRGIRSGIGIGAFQHGGFLVDAGRNVDSAVPPVVSRTCFPSSWRVLIVLDVAHRGLHGKDEHASFLALPAFPSQTAAYLCRLVMMQVLPAIVEQDIGEFGEGVYEVQKCLGKFFASVQGGRYTSAAVGDVIRYIESTGIQGVGQSSWGPTGFAFVDSETQAHILLRDVQARFSDNQDLRFKVVSGRNTGAIIEQQDNISLPKANRS